MLEKYIDTKSMTELQVGKLKTEGTGNVNTSWQYLLKHIGQCVTWLAYLVFKVSPRFDGK